MKWLVASYIAQLAFWSVIFVLLWVAFIAAILWPRRHR
jgi:hypothetical protein